MPSGALNNGRPYHRLPIFLGEVKGASEKCAINRLNRSTIKWCLGSANGMQIRYKIMRIRYMEDTF